MSAGVALARENPSAGFVPYQFPKLLMMLSRTSARRATMNSIAGKIKEKSHGSAKQIIAEDFPYIKQLFSGKDYAISMSREFSFDEKEIAFLLGAKEDSKEVQEIFSESEAAKPKEPAKKSGILFSESQEKEAEGPEPMQTKLF